LELSPAIHVAATVTPPASRPHRPIQGWAGRRARTRSYLQGYAARRRSPRFRIR